MVSLGQHVKSYFSETSLHGLKYITEDDRHTVERILWVILFTVAVALMITFMIPGQIILCPVSVSLSTLQHNGGEAYMLTLPYFGNLRQKYLTKDASTILKI